jgi:alpha-mannosidase
MEFDKTKQALLLRKIMRRKDEIKDYMISNKTPITDIVFRENVGWEPYDADKKFKPIKVGDQWAGGRNAWFKLKLRVPTEWKGKEYSAFISAGSEGCAFLNGAPYQGLDKNHEEIPLSQIVKPGQEGEFVLDMHSTYWWDPPKGEAHPVKVSRAELATWNPEVKEYYYNLDTLHLLACELPEDSPRRVRIIYTLNQSVDAFDYDHLDEASLKRSAMRADRILNPLLRCEAAASATSVAVHGHSHIDVAWLWPYLETKRKCSRTFSTVLRLMENYPEYLFTQSQAQLYDFARETYPELYKQIKKRVKEGRWDVNGSMWVEADCNVCSGESLVRQVLVGKQFFKDEFGLETDVLWLPDVFGYSAALPQILLKSGVPYFSTIKISWSQFNKFPYSTFYWKGIDGSRVLAHFPPTGDYNAFPEPRKLMQQISNFHEKDRCDWSLLSYGWGDGGGGPDRRHLEYLRRSKDLEGLPRCKQMGIGEFFHKIDGTPDLPEWAGELYLELHRGTYTTQGHNKAYNRQAEFLYREAELLSTIAETMGLAYPREDLQREWKRILCNQFHDVIPGSSIRQVYEETDQMYPEILDFGRSVCDKAGSKIASGVAAGDGLTSVILNSLPWDRRDLAAVTAPGKGEFAIVDPEGKTVPSQRTGDRISFVADVPSMGYAAYGIVERKARSRSDVRVSRRSLENRFFTISLDPKGVITSIIEKSTGREVVPKGQRANLLQLFEDKPSDWPAWDIDFHYDDKWEDITSLESLEIVEKGPVRGAIEITRNFGKSKIRQTMAIYADIPRIDFKTWIDWHEDEKVLKASFPVDVNATKARYEIQFGNVERPTHTNTSWDFARFEVPAQRWADISEEGFGMSLMNDCKYGYHTKGNVMRLTLLRSPKSPDEEADMGEHTFTYSIMPHAGDYVSAQTVRRAYELNVPLSTLSASGARGKNTLPAKRSFFSVDADNVVLETVKKAEQEDATILRMYECHNQRANVTLQVGIPFKNVYECDLLERNVREIKSKDGAISLQIKPFEILTLKLTL